MQAVYIILQLPRNQTNGELIKCEIESPDSYQYNLPVGSNSPKVVSLFSGAGCFDLGFEAAGFQTILTNDVDEDCCDTIISNRKWNTVHAPIESLRNEDLKKLSQLRPKELDLLIGGPPCQPFSKSAYGTVADLQGFDDDRANTVREYLRVVELLLPRAFIIENVPQFISGKNVRTKQYIQRMISRINTQKRTNYRLSFCQLNAAWFGVPQLRERLFIVASRDGKPFEIPSPRFLWKEDPDLGIQKYRSAWDALGADTNNVETMGELAVGGKWGTLLKTVPPGQNYLWHTARGGGQNIFKWRARYWNFLLKLHPMQPSWTIAAHPGQHTGPFHWGNRRLTVNELKALQTIPKAYRFYGSGTSIRRQIGNGVPSALGELLGKEVRRQFFDQRVTSENLLLIPKRRQLDGPIKRLIQRVHALEEKFALSYLARAL